MKLAPILALALLAGCAAARTAGEAPPADLPPAEATQAAARAERAALSRAMTVIDDAGRRGDIAAERARWTAAAQADERDVTARMLALYALPHTDDTWAEVKALSRLRKDSDVPLLGMARIYVGWGVLDQVERTLQVDEAVAPDDFLVTLLRGQAAEAGERWEAAATAYRAVVAADRVNVVAHVGLARLARRAGDVQAARLEADAALAALPEHAPALSLLAGLSADAGDVPGAIARAYRAVAASPRDRPTRVTLAKLLQARGDAAAARDQWRAALALREDHEGLLALAEVSRLCGDQEAEQQALERLSALEPGAAEWKRIAEIRLTAGDADGAEKALRRALARDARDGKACLALGRILARSNRPQEALELLRAAGPDGAADRTALEQRLNVERPARGDVAAVQRAVGGLIDRTYRARLKDLPRLSGQLTVRVTVDAAGGATLVEVLEDSVHDDDVRACAYWNLRDAAYPPSKPGRYSFTFALRPAR